MALFSPSRAATEVPCGFACPCCCAHACPQRLCARSCPFRILLLTWVHLGGRAQDGPEASTRRLRSLLLENIWEAMLTDANADNAMAGFELCAAAVDAEVVRLGSGVHMLTTPLAWVHLYQAWNACFVHQLAARTAGDGMLGMAALCQPSLGRLYQEVDPHEYFTQRSVTLWLMLQYAILRQVDPAKQQGRHSVACGPLQPLWGQVNRHHAELHRQRRGAARPVRGAEDLAAAFHRMRYVMHRSVRPSMADYRLRVCIGLLPRL